MGAARNRTHLNATAILSAGALPSGRPISSSVVSVLPCYRYLPPLGSLRCEAELIYQQPFPKLRLGLQPVPTLSPDYDRSPTTHYDIQ